MINKFQRIPPPVPDFYSLKKGNQERIQIGKSKVGTLKFQLATMRKQAAKSEPMANFLEDRIPEIEAEIATETDKIKGAEVQLQLLKERRKGEWSFAGFRNMLRGKFIIKRETPTAALYNSEKAWAENAILQCDGKIQLASKLLEIKNLPEEQREEALATLEREKLFKEGFEKRWKYMCNMARNTNIGENPHRRAMSPAPDYTLRTPAPINPEIRFSWSVDDDLFKEWHVNENGSNIFSKVRNRIQRNQEAKPSKGKEIDRGQNDFIQPIETGVSADLTDGLLMDFDQLTETNAAIQKNHERILDFARETEALGNIKIEKRIQLATQAHNKTAKIPVGEASRRRAYLDYAEALTNSVSTMIEEHKRKG